MPHLDLSPDELLSTTRAVRRRLDFDRPVPPEVLKECLELALQAPSASDSRPWSFVVVTDDEPKAAIAEHYRKSYGAYAGQRAAGADPESPRGRALARVRTSSSYLAERFHEVPAYVIPCLRGRYEQASASRRASMYGSVIQAAWSFQLAARARGLGSCWTTLHLDYEREVAELLQIPYAEVTQVALITVGYSLGTDFKAAPGRDLSRVVHWQHW